MHFWQNATSVYKKKDLFIYGYSMWQDSTTAALKRGHDFRWWWLMKSGSRHEWWWYDYGIVDIDFILRVWPEIQEGKLPEWLDQHPVGNCDSWRKIMEQEVIERVRSWKGGDDDDPLNNPLSRLTYVSRYVEKATRVQCTWKKKNRSSSVVPTPGPPENGSSLEFFPPLW